MIQLASDPNASRMSRRPESTDKEPVQQARAGRTGHAWPFISRYAEKPGVPQLSPEPDEGAAAEFEG
ncbi:MAG TPA: hypothetical protein VHA82_00505 [Ramlibacter sp.]|uniref:hypothetical protein n=1 Tax=Ramlibacter sp. TaxID=1917967 RepID=UPI002B680599|nr:hypothetical protein [Ramlibacter sp.]HVZ42260.1 hypothetical protein [Ramlibacter sp.]